MLKYISIFTSLFKLKIRNQSKSDVVNKVLLKMGEKRHIYWIKLNLIVILQYLFYINSTQFIIT